MFVLVSKTHQLHVPRALDCGCVHFYRVACEILPADLDDVSWWWRTNGQRSNKLQMSAESSDTQTYAYIIIGRSCSCKCIQNVYLSFATYSHSSLSLMKTRKHTARNCCWTRIYFSHIIFFLFFSDFVEKIRSTWSICMEEVTAPNESLNLLIEIVDMRDKIWVYISESIACIQHPYTLHDLQTNDPLEQTRQMPTLLFFFSFLLSEIRIFHFAWLVTDCISIAIHDLIRDHGGSPHRYI